MKATLLLRKQHRTVEGLFKRLESSRVGSAELVEELADDLAAHMAIEQKTFYPIARQIDEALVLESYEEHAMAELALKRLLSTLPKDEAFKPRLAVLKNLIMHHVEEEELDLFPKVEKRLSSGRLATLGEEMEEAFEAAKERGFASLVPKTSQPSKTSADVAKRHGPNGAAHGHGARRAGMP